MAPSRSASRRLQRSTRITVAIALLALAAVVVAWGVLDNVAWFTAASAVIALVLGAAATRIMHRELLQSRRDAAADRAILAQDYAELAETRGAEHRAEVVALRGDIAGLTTQSNERATQITKLEQSLVAAEAKVQQAEREIQRLGSRVDDAESRAAEAIVHLAELEQEAETLRAELLTWQSYEPQTRQHA
ncbi:MAG: hypothetical protein V9G04_01150 [Nocardioides sp.]|jgi:chromosome segregation ATPase